MAVARVGSSLLVRMAKSWVASLDAMAFPLSCHLCGVDGLSAPFCDACRGMLLASAGPACARCAMPVGPWSSSVGGCPECRGRPLGFDGAVALGPYKEPIRDLCLRLKRLGDAWLAPWMTGLLLDARGEAIRAWGADLVVPVPLHWARRLSRGYDQAEALASALARGLSLPMARPLRRKARTAALAGLGRAARAEVLKGAFKTRRGTNLRGRTVLLVDDILTTGSTCGVAARSLKAAGATRVIAVVLGRAEGRA